MTLQQPPMGGIEILRAQPSTTPGAVLATFDVRMGGVTVHGCRLVVGKRGRFVGWPSRRAAGGEAWEPVVEVNESIAQRVLALAEAVLQVPDQTTSDEVPF